MFGFLSKRKTAAPEERRGLFQSFRSGLRRTRDSLLGGLSRLLPGGRAIDAGAIDAVEECLLLADVGVEATGELIERLRERHRQQRLADGEALRDALREEMVALLSPVEVTLELPAAMPGPYVVLVVGVNGAGKTTTIGKIARLLRDDGRSVMLAAGDTFRAAAVEQLRTWGDRLGIPVVAQGAGADSASVIYDALAAARARGVDVLIADTAGRLHTRSNLMDELKKIRRVLGKLDPTAPHETLIVIDATVGGNGLAQAREFHNAVGVTGIALTKMDGTARGGIIFAIARSLKLPIRFVGVGEQADDLRVFEATTFVDALLARDDAGPS